MNRYLSKAWNMSPAKLWAAIANPRLTFAKCTAPKQISNADAILSLFPKLTSSAVEKCRMELLTNNKFYMELDTKLLEKRYRRINYAELSEFLYMAVRFAKPQIIFETGVFDGQSSAVILQALNDNGDGQLVSIDLPAVETIKASTECMGETTLPQNCQPGWVVPDYLRDRYRLILGDSKKALPQLFYEYPSIDMFLHDSLHTFEHQYFEYITAWPHLSEGGLLLSDDIYWSLAFHSFCRQKNTKYLNIGGFGAVRK